MAPVPSAPTIWTASPRKNGSGTHCAHVVRVLSSLSLELRVETEGTVWLGGDLAANASEATRKAGFGRDIHVARWPHTRWLLDQGLDGTRRGGSPSSATCWPPYAGAK